MRPTWITLCILVAGCFSDSESIQGGTDESSESGSESGGSEGASASSTTTGTSTSGGSSSTTSAETSGSSSSEESDASSSGSESGSGGLGESYAPCMFGYECESGTCLTTDGIDGGYCSQLCATTPECPEHEALPVACADGIYGDAAVCVLQCETMPEECPEGTECGGGGYPAVCG